MSKEVKEKMKDSKKKSVKKSFTKEQTESDKRADFRTRVSYLIYESGREFTEWEQSYLEDIEQILIRGKGLSENQETKLTEIEEEE